MTIGGFSSKRLTRVRDVLSRHLDAGYVPGAVAVVARRGEVHIEAMGNLAFEGEGARTPMAADTICRTGSMTKPIVAACAMTLVEDCTLRLDDPVDEFLPELADMTVLADPNGPLDRTVPAQRAITLRDLLTFTLGTGMVPAAPGTIPIADALNASVFEEPAPPPDEWIRRLGKLPLVCQPGERWMYHTAANVTGRAHRPGDRHVLRRRRARAGLRAARDEGHRLQRARREHRPPVDRVPASTPPAGSSSRTAPTGTGASRRSSRTAGAGSSRPPPTTSPSGRPCWPAAPCTASGCCRGRR